jgi:hypothetical protein
MRFFRLAGWAFFTMTAMLGVSELVHHVRDGSSTFTDVGRFWAQMRPASLGAVQSFLQPLVGPTIWGWFLRAPVMAVTACVGIALMLVDSAMARRIHHT